MRSHDECGWCKTDESWLKRHLDAGAMLAENARFCVKLLEGSTVYVWNDMFDPFHNAHGDYYLVRGSWANSWEGLSKDVIIMNWNFGKRDESLKFFADRGHRQVLAGYYDAPPIQVKEWVKSVAKVKGIVGIMFPTWQNKYTHIVEFFNDPMQAPPQTTGL